MRRPHSITAVAWLFIAVGTVGLLKDIWPLVTHVAAQQIAKLRADGLADIVPAWTSRVLAIVGGVALLRGHSWARWLLVAWMVFHVVLSLVHDLPELVIHVAIFAPVLFLLFRRSMGPWFHGGDAAPA